MFGITLAKIIESILMYAIVHCVYWLFSRLFGRSERTLAIWLHYQARARREGHKAASVLHCNDGKCAIL